MIFLVGIVTVSFMMAAGELQAAREEKASYLNLNSLKLNKISIPQSHYTYLKYSTAIRGSAY